MTNRFFHWIYHKKRVKQSKPVKKRISHFSQSTSCTKIPFSSHNLLLNKHLKTRTYSTLLKPKPHPSNKNFPKLILVRTKHRPSPS